MEKRKNVWVTPSASGKRMRVDSSEPGHLETAINFDVGLKKIGDLVSDGHSRVSVFTDHLGLARQRILDEIKAAAKEAAKAASKEVRVEEVRQIKN